MQEGKSKRDLIWEQKKRAREALLQNGGAPGAGSQNIPENNNPPPNFAKKSPIYDNPEPEIIQPAQPLGSQDTNRGRKFANVMDDIANNKPASQPSNNNPRIQVHDFAAQDNQYQPEPMMPMNNQNQPRRQYVEEPMQAGPKPNFNPSYQQSGGYEPIGGRESREGGVMDPRKKKADYGEELRNQMRSDQIKKQQEKNEVRNSQNLNQQQQQQQGGDQYFRDMEKRRKEEYADYLKQQMQAKQDSKRQEIARDMYERPMPSQQQQQQQAYAPRQYQQQQQQVYQPPPQQQQQIYQAPPRQQQYQPERLEMNNDPYGQRQAGYAMERAGSVEPIQRSDTADYGRGNSMGNVDNLMPNYQRGNTLEAGGERGKRKGFESEDPIEMAKKDRMKQDFQKGLQEQIEFKKRQKEMEKQRQLQEDRIEEERIRKEQQELARRQAEEDPKNKVMAKFQDMEKNANNLIQQQQQLVQEKPSRRRGNAQSVDQQSRAPPSQDPNQFQPPPSFQQNQQPPPGYPQQQQQPPPYYPPPYGHGYPYAQPYSAPYGYPGYPGHPGHPGHPGQHPYYPPPQNPASFPSMPRNEAISSELQQIRAEIQNQQAVFAKQLQMIQKEAMNVVDGRDKAEQELLHLREKLKDKISHDNAYDKNLRDVLERNNPNAQAKAPRTKDSNPVRAIHRDPEPALESYSYQAYQPKPNKPSSNNQNTHIERERERNYEEFTFPAAPDINKPTYDVRRTNQKVMDDQHLHQFDDSYMPALDIEKTLAGNTKMIPLAVFDNKPGIENTRSLERDPLTLSKIHNFASSNLGQMHSNQKNNRPNSSKQWQQKDEDSIDFLIKAHGPRPGSSESQGYGDTSHMIGRRLDEASELLRQVDVMGRGADRTNLRSRDKETFSTAGRNILGDKQSMNVGNYGGKRGGYPDSERNSLISRGDEGIRMNNHDLLPDLSMNSHQAREHFGNPNDNSLLNMTGTSFNVEKINLANEARLHKWDSVGTGSIRSDGSNYDKYGGAGRGNYYNRGGGGLEAIQEDDDANDKLDKMLGGYIRTHEDLKAQDDYKY